MRIVAVSDLHGHLPDVPECDLLLLGGDLCPVQGSHDPATQSRWLRGPFRAWLNQVPAREVVGVAGNHDFVFERSPELVPNDLRWTYLQDSGTEKFGLKIYGLPWQPRFFDWAFNADPPKMKAVADAVPGDTDLLVMHGPPHGYGDEARRYEPPARSNQTGCLSPPARHVTHEHVGCPHLLDRVAQTTHLKLAVFGHIHDGYGVYHMGNKVLANVAHVNERYEPVNRPVVFHTVEDNDGVIRVEPLRDRV